MESVSLVVQVQYFLTFMLSTQVSRQKVSVRRYGFFDGQCLYLHLASTGLDPLLPSELL